jgi:hypothetical protein
MAVSDGTLRLSAPRLVVMPRSEPRRPVSRPVPVVRRSWLDRLLRRRREPSTYQRCLAIHIHFAGPHSALS